MTLPLNYTLNNRGNLITAIPLADLFDDINLYIKYT